MSWRMAVVCWSVSDSFLSSRPKITMIDSNSTPISRLWFPGSKLSTRNSGL